MQKRKTTIQGFAFLLLLFCGILTAEAKEQLRIMTFNVPKGNIPAVGLNTWPNRAVAIQNFLNEAKPDLLGMQEPPVSELTDLLVGMPGYTMLGVARDDGKQLGEYSPIIYRTSRFSVERSGTYWLSLTPDVVSKNWDSNCIRIATWAVFRDKVTKARFLYTNTHLDHISEEARYQQMRVIKEHIKQIFDEEGEMPAFITGDFNSNKANTKSPVTVATGYLTPMNDAYKVAKKKKGVTYTFPSSQVKIDYIIVTKDVSVETAYIHNSIYDNGQQLSDHNAHYADISWATTQEQKRDSLLAVAQSCYDSLLVFNTPTERLITDASDNGQIICDEVEAGSTYKMLTDLSIGTCFFSKYTSPLSAGNLHYLQVDLKRDDVSAFRLRLERSRTTAISKLAPTDIRVEASNDSTTWNYITDLNDISYATTGVGLSSIISMPRAYRFLRFSVMRTSNMDIVNSGPRFALTEFQLQLATLDETNSQRYRNAEIKAAADVLQEKMEAASESTTQETFDALSAAIQTVRSLYIPLDAYNTQLENAKTMLNTFSVGTALGQTSQEAMDALKKGVEQVETTTNLTGGKAEIEAAIASLQTLMDDFKDQLIYFEEGKWFYLINHARITSGTTRNRVLYSGGNSTQMPLLNAQKDSTGLSLAGSSNPYAMWRFVRTDAGKHTYALQNRATGFYLGQIAEEGQQCFVSSTTPISFVPEFTAEGEFSLSLLDSDGRSMSASTDGYLYNAVGGASSNASWVLREVSADLKTVEIPVITNSISVVCFPYAINDLKQLNPNVQGYAVNSVSLLTVYFEKKENFAAGEPFVLMVGDPTKFDASSVTTEKLKLTPPDEFTDQALTANGLVGVLDKTKVASGYFFQNNKLTSRTSTSYVGGQSGYIVRSQVVSTGNPIDLTARLNNEIVITALHDITVTDGEKNSVVYDLNGRRISLDANHKLGKGIYIIDNKKVRVE